jgi:hypothetical protein
MGPMNRPGFVLALLALAAGATPAPERAKDARPSKIGLAVNLEETPSAADQRRVLDQVRATGASLVAVAVSWRAAEPFPGKYHIEDVIRAVRLLRQSGATVHLDLPLVAGRERQTPPDLAVVAFDDSKLSIRLGRLLDALEPALLDCSTLSLGYEADVYFSDKPGELKAYRRLFDGAVSFLEKKVPSLMVGVTTVAPTESPAPIVAAMLHQHSPVLFYVYAPFEPGKPYVHRAPAAIERDWGQLLQRAGGRPIAFPEVSFSSSAENGSSPEKQAEFVRRLRRLAARTDGSKLLFVRYATLRDGPANPAASGETPEASRRVAFFANRGLQTASGEPKAAWKEWAKGR